MADAQPKEKSSHVIPMTVNDLIYMQLQDFKAEFRNGMDKFDAKIDTVRKDLNDRMDKLDARMDRIDARMDKIDARIDKLDAKIDTVRKELNDRMDKQDAKIDRLADKIDALSKKQDAKIDRLADKIDALSKKMDSSTNHGQIITVSAIGIAVGVLLSMFFK